MGKKKHPPTPGILAECKAFLPVSSSGRGSEPPRMLPSPSHVSHPTPQIILSAPLHVLQGPTALPLCPLGCHSSWATTIPGRSSCPAPAPGGPLLPARESPPVLTLSTEGERASRPRACGLSDPHPLLIPASHPGCLADVAEKPRLASATGPLCWPRLFVFPQRLAWLTPYCLKVGP